MRIKTIQNEVKHVLMHDPATRNNDQLLYIRVCERLNPHVTSRCFKDVLLNLNDLHLPTIESVGRCRRKLQADNPTLRANDKVKGFRNKLEAEFREYARSSDG